MISLDMKYTSLYWALRFVENKLDIHNKFYKDCEITIDAENQKVDYSNKIIVKNEVCSKLVRHKDFVILECVDRLLTKGYKPNEIILQGGENKPDIIVVNFKIYCEQWGNDFKNFSNSFEIINSNDIAMIYTSRLVSGLLEYKNLIFTNNDIFNYGFFEDNIKVHEIKPIKAKNTVIENISDINDYEIFEDELIRYKGNSKKVIVPNGITTIGASAFWDCTSVVEIQLPETLTRIGGDAFYYCKNLEKLVIPKSVWIMGNNPFAGCPKLILENKSEHFQLIDRILYNKDLTNLIHYTISKTDKTFSIPNSVICLGKHCFYDCNNIEHITIPESVIKFENNPFSGCEKLTITNKSSYYHIEEGVIYNKFKTTIIGCLNGSKIAKLEIPESVTLISRNSFWNCKNINKIVLSKNINRIGYNPFAGCSNFELESKNDKFVVENGILYNQDFTLIICCPNLATGKTIKIRDTVKSINRGAFSGCLNLKEIDFINVTYIDKSSFTNCISIEEIYFPDNVTYIGEWAFAYCLNLKKVQINSKTIIDKNAFSQCPVEIEIR